MDIDRNARGEFVRDDETLLNLIDRQQAVIANLLDYYDGSLSLMSGAWEREYRTSVLGIEGDENGYEMVLTRDQQRTLNDARVARREELTTLYETLRTDVASIMQTIEALRGKL